MSTHAAFPGKQDREPVPKFQIIRSPYNFQVSNMEVWSVSMTKKEIKLVNTLYITDDKCTHKNLNRLPNCYFITYFYIQPPVSPFWNVLYWLCFDFANLYLCTNYLINVQLFTYNFVVLITNCTKRSTSYILLYRHWLLFYESHLSNTSIYRRLNSNCLLKSLDPSCTHFSFKAL